MEATGVRAIILVGIALLAASLAGCLQRAPHDDANGVTIEVKASRYKFDPGTLTSINVTKGQVVTLRLTSLDVTHGFAITEYGIQQEVAPGQTVEVHFTADKTGDFVIYCTVFCGTGHPQHKGTLHVA